MTLPLISLNILSITFILMHDWKAMDVTVYLEPRYQGHSFSDQCYEFCTQFDAVLQCISWCDVIQSNPALVLLIPRRPTWPVVALATEHTQVQRIICKVLSLPKYTDV